MAVASTSGPMTEPSHQSFHSSPLTTKQQQSLPDSSGSSETSSKPTSDTPDANYQSDSSVHSRRDVETQSPAYLKSEEYRLLFRLPSDEMLVQDFNCALQESILFQGHMYLFIHHICFYSNIFGFETKKAIHFKEFKCVRKAKTAAIFPNAIEIMAGDKKYFFASFLSRDEAYRLIVDGWSQHCKGTEVLLDHQELKSEIRIEDRGCIVLEDSKGVEKQTSDCSQSINRNEEGDHSEDSKLLSNSDDDVTISSSPSEALENGVGDAEVIVEAEHVSARKSLRWKVEDADPPRVPDCYTKVAESKFPVQVEEFFNLFCSDKAIKFIDAFHRKCGDKELRCTSWSEHKEFGYTREMSFQHPIKIYLGAKYGTCHEVQRFRVYNNSHLVIETSQEVSNVPYGDYFTVQGLWEVETDGNNFCIVRVYTNVAFSRKTMWKGKIETSTIEECREAYSVWLNSAHELLKENLEKSEESLASGMNTSSARCEGHGRDESSLNISHDASDVLQIPVMASDTKNIISPLENSGHRGFFPPQFSTRLCRESLARFSVNLKNQNDLTLFLAIAFILILLMQLSIIVLLSRRPQVHIISQTDQMNQIGSHENNLVEAGAWLEKRFHYLKDEMYMVEARLENMRQEYALLKEHFKGLEQLRKA